jgi:hypothetical protein
MGWDPIKAFNKGGDESLSRVAAHLKRGESFSLGLGLKSLSLLKNLYYITTLVERLWDPIPGAKFCTRQNCQAVPLRCGGATPRVFFATDPLYY